MFSQSRPPGAIPISSIACDGGGSRLLSTDEPIGLNKILEKKNQLMTKWAGTEKNSIGRRDGDRRPGL